MSYWKTSHNKPKEWICSGGPLGSIKLDAVGLQEAASAYLRMHKDAGLKLTSCRVRRPQQGHSATIRFPEAA